MRIVPLYHTHCIIHRTQHRRRGDGRNSFVWICMVFLHCWFGWKGGGEGSNVLHHRHTFVSGIGDGDGVDSLGPWWRRGMWRHINGWMDGWRSATYANHLAFIPNSFASNVYLMSSLNVQMKTPSQTTWHRNPNRTTINQSKQVSAFRPIHICSFISSNSSHRMKRRQEVCPITTSRSSLEPLTTCPRDVFGKSTSAAVAPLAHQIHQC
jgi:hypothetical protein